MNWTPISESFPPDEYNEYYVTVEHPYGPRFTYRAIYKNNEWEFHNEDGIMDHYSYGWKIVAWMPTDDPEPWTPTQSVVE